MIKKVGRAALKKTDGLRSQYVECYNATKEMLKRAAEHADQGNFEVAEAWLGNADVFFGKTSAAFFRLNKALNSSEEEYRLLEEMYELQGDIEGAVAVIRENWKS